MIHSFGTRRKRLFFPVRWGNSVVRWICGVCSPSGTVKIQNTLNPKDGGTLKLDADVPLIASLVYEELKRRRVL